jgi:UDP-N-acetylglucosamine/UDP-N-acetylgalactosamine diphosphorylase
MAQTVKSKMEAARKQLGAHGQEHVMRFAEQLNRPEQLQLLKDIDSLDLALIDQLIDTYIRKQEPVKLPDKISPPPVYPITATAELERKYQNALQRGERLIAERKVAAFTVAGGMGTRLSFDGPKGCLPATAVRNKTLFRLFAESLIATGRRYNSIIPWYIMTSQANHEDTVHYFEENNYFRLNPETVFLFQQGMMPSFDQEGKILMSAPHQPALSPDGHGGSLRALYNSGAVKDMAQRGVEYISYFQVDNPLVQVVDPLFIGLHALDNAEMSSKAVIKCDPLERVGNFTLADGKITVIEYSDLPEELARQTREDGRLMFELGSIAIHIISRSFVERINKHGFSLPWHRALKKVPYLDESGNLIEPEQPNSIKLETFVFDALPLAEASVILAIERNDEFAPIKNAAGVDSLQSSQQLQIEKAARWIQKAGIDIPRKDDGSVDALIEISPLYALDIEEFLQKRRLLRPLKPGDIVYLG